MSKNKHYLIPYFKEDGWLSFRGVNNRDFISRVVESTKDAILFDGESDTRSRYLILTSSACVSLALEDASQPITLPNEMRETASDIPEALSDLPFCSGVCGYLSYDYGVAQTCPASSVTNSNGECIEQPKLPLAFVGYYTWSYIVDLVDDSAFLSFSPNCSEALRREIIKLYECAAPNDKHKLRHAADRGCDIQHSPWSKNLSYKEYSVQLEQISDYILSGDCYQVNFTQRYQAKLDNVLPTYKVNTDPNNNTLHDTYTGKTWALYESIRESSNAHYGGFLKLNDGQHILSFSPEQFLHINSRKVTTKPIKGTIDSRLMDSANRLLSSKKDRAENLMIVDLLRNDLGMVCKTGSVNTSKLFDIETYKHLHHMVSTIEGELRDDISAFDALLACFPGGSITGAPKKRAMEIIQELEQHKRSAYCGSMFYLSDHGNMDSNILIRSIVHDRGDLYCWSGGGIVADSETDSEYAESLTKVRHITGLND